MLTYPKFRLTADDRRALLGDFLPYAEIVVRADAAPARFPASRETDDTVFIHLAVMGQADFLVSGDGDLTALKAVSPVPILAVSALRTVLAEQRSQ